MKKVTLSDLQLMEEYVAIYVPSTLYNKPTDNTEQVNMVCKELSNLCGGATVYPTQGGYVADNGEYISERVHIVKAFTSHISEELLGRVIEIAQQLKNDMQQECISVEIDGGIAFV